MSEDTKPVMLTNSSVQTAESVLRKVEEPITINVADKETPKQESTQVGFMMDSGQMRQEIDDLTSENNAALIQNNQMLRMMMRQAKVQKVRKYAKVGRNEPCPCGSGKKYKNCCLKTGEYEGLKYINEDE